MSGLGLPEERPALEWVNDMPPEWTTPVERLVLLGLALDSFDGYACAPSRGAVMRIAGIKWSSTFTRARDALAQETPDRPALIEVDSSQGRRTRYRLVRDRPTSGDGGETCPPNLSAELVRDTCPPNLSATDRRPLPNLPTLREEGEVEALDAPAPDVAGRERLPIEDTRALLVKIVPAPALEGVDCGNEDLRDALVAAWEAGWRVSSASSALAGMKKARKSPTGQVIARLRNLLELDPAAIMTAPDSPREIPDPFADSNQAHVANFCKWTGADREALTSALTDFIADGYTVEVDMRGAINAKGKPQKEEVEWSIEVTHPDLDHPDGRQARVTWVVYADDYEWTTYLWADIDMGVDEEMGERLRAAFDRHELEVTERTYSNGEAYLDFQLPSRPGDVATLRRYVTGLLPPAIECLERHLRREAAESATPEPPDGAGNP